MMRSERTPWFLARCAPGLEKLLQVEVKDRLEADAETAAPGLVRITFDGDPHRIGELLTVDDTWVFVRAIEGDFRHERELGALCKKLGKTETQRALASLRRLTDVPLRPKVKLIGAARGGSLRFFDLQRECGGAVAKALGGIPSEKSGDVLALLLCTARQAVLGLELPLQPVPLTSQLLKAADGHPSVAGAVILLARPVRGLSVCDPDAAGGGLLSAWSHVAPPRRAIGLDRRAVEAVGNVSVVAAPPDRWPLKDGSVSRVISLLPRVTRPLQFAGMLGELARCIARGGTAALATPAAELVREAVTAQPRLTVEAVYTARTLGRRIAILQLSAASTDERRGTETTAGDRFRASISAQGGQPKAPARRQRRNGEPRDKTGSRTRPKRRHDDRRAQHGRGDWRRSPG